MSTVNQCQFCGGIAKQNLFNACCSHCCMIFVLNRHKNVTIFIKCFSPILLCFVSSRYFDIFGVKAFRIKPVCEILEQVIDLTMKEIVNTALNA